MLRSTSTPAIALPQSPGGHASMISRFRRPQIGLCIALAALAVLGLGGSHHEYSKSAVSTILSSTTLPLGAVTTSLFKGSPASAVQRVVSASHYDYNEEVAEVLQTRMLAHSPGFTVLDNLFFFNNTMYLVSDNKTAFPELHEIADNEPYSFGRIRSPNLEDYAHMIKQISTHDAAKLFGSRVIRHRGVKFWIRDTFIQHLAHFMEIILGMWKVYAVGVSPKGDIDLPLPNELIFPFSDELSWRDWTRQNSFMIKAAFPEHSYTYADDLSERQEFGLVDVYDRVVVGDRNSSVYCEECRGANKVAAGVVLLKSHPHFFEPFRQSILASLPGQPRAKQAKTVITYISRQGGQRRLIKEDHDRIVMALRTLGDNFEIIIADMGSLGQAEQIELAARTDIMLGLHGKGMTHLFWMKPGSLVIEMLYPGGWARDFELPATTVGHRHVAVHNDTTIRWEEMAPAMVIPEGFHGNSIPARPGPIIDAIRNFVAEKDFAPHKTRHNDDGSYAI